ncbi:MAG TPA: c-type cytochrome, partial [Isosphaeraceae bacterium]|nr:c-type cytochrome [Isosphaeraceae bacterium]
TSDNDDDGNRGSRVIWIMDGGHYGYRTPGSPRHWGEDVPGNMPKLVGTGNGSPCGVMVYEGDHLPAEYHGAVFEAEAGTRQINAFPLTRHGATFRTEPRVLLASADPWFRPVDMTAAPDGSLFVADWYDAGVGGHGFRDQTTGRIYRVTSKERKAEAKAADFGTVRGLIAALRSPTVATQDAARRALIERAKTDRQEVETSLVTLYSSSSPIERARALWVLHAVAGDRAAVDALKDTDPRLREQGVRILGRDDRENGHVEYKDGAEKQSPPALKHLAALLPLAADADAGVRRELILALRNVPTEQAGEALKTLTRAWDGRDRWYLECLGLALDQRDSAFIAGLFDGTLYGDLDLDETGQAAKVAVPPYFPVDRNEAFIAAGTPDLPVSALSKTLGLAWRVHRPEVLPVLSRVLAKLSSPELQQAADDVLAQMRDGRTAVVLAEIAGKAEDPARQRQILATLASKLDSVWGDARRSPEIVTMTEAALKDPELRLEAVAVAAATGDARYAPAVLALARDEKASAELRAAAVEAAARFNDPKARELVVALIREAKGKKSAGPAVEAAVRSLPRQGGDTTARLLELIGDKDYPLGLRREALRTLARQRDGGKQVLDLAREKKLSDDLKTEASSLLSANPDQKLRHEAAGVLPQPKGRGGRPLPSFFDMVRKEGQADRGRDVFFRAGNNSCSGCHRVQGRGQWIGPDLSTIGTKYGRDELLRSILNPSAAISHNFRSQVVGLDDGRVLTGLPVEDSADRLVLKTAAGERVAVPLKQIDDRKESDVSLMPEGLAETMTDQELADLLSFLSALRQPVSIIGQYQVIGPVAESKDTPAFDPTRPVDPSLALKGPEGQKLSWRRLDANAESLADLNTLVGDAPSKSAYLYAPVVSAIAQQARLVLDTKAEIKVWLNGKSLSLPDPSDGQSRSLSVDLLRGKNDLLIRVGGGPSLAIVTTLVTDRPVSFRTDEEKVSGR